ncbi:MAG: hypothetical protein QM809_11425 [Gordonia sp. (in: high G+C Gram-positive bacteria)]|uniref:hypothetical protein n=1 Tax=Gordonia sp. (in: high G+C Gram-positive bacteria) TaxID=84139 RepID=UPI0039E30F1B
MAGHGGARNRSGPAPSLTSARSDARDVRAKRLPVGGYRGDFPPLSEFLPDATEREGQVWADLWRTPQASQWAVESWRHRTVAMYVRWLVRAEDPEATAATITASQRMADQIGMTPAGLRENGWLIVADDSAVHPDQVDKQAAAKRAGKTRTNGGGRRMRSV